MPVSRCMRARRKCGIGRASDQQLATSSNGEHTLRWKGRECGEEGWKQRQTSHRIRPRAHRCHHETTVCRPHNFESSYPTSTNTTNIPREDAQKEGRNNEHCGRSKKNEILVCPEGGPTEGAPAFFLASMIGSRFLLIFCERTQNKTSGRDNPHDDVDDAPPDNTTQHNSAQHELALCDRCHTAWASGAHGWVPAGHPRYTRADYGQEAVGGSTSRARARDTGHRHKL